MGDQLRALVFGGRLVIGAAVAHLIGSEFAPGSLPWWAATLTSLVLSLAYLLELVASFERWCRYRWRRWHLRRAIRHGEARLRAFDRG